jgi:integrase
LRVFGLWHDAKFNQAFEPANLTNYDLHIYRKWSLDQEKVKAATWNSRHWALGILCTHIAQPELMDGIELKEQMEGSEKHRALTDLEHHRLVNIIELDTRRGKENPLQALTVFEYTTAIRNWAAISLMLHAGLRVDECAMVEADSITINDRSGIVIVRNGKGGKQRKVTLNLPLRNALKACFELKPTTKTLFGICPRSLQRITNEIGKRIGVPDLTPHWLRYTFAKRLEKNNVPMEGIRRLLGHKNIETTKVYLRSSMEDLQSAVDGVV